MMFFMTAAYSMIKDITEEERQRQRKRDIKEGRRRRRIQHQMWEINRLAHTIGALREDILELTLSIGALRDEWELGFVAMESIQEEDVMAGAAAAMSAEGIMVGFTSVPFGERCIGKLFRLFCSSSGR